MGFTAGLEKNILFQRQHKPQWKRYVWLSVVTVRRQYIVNQALVFDVLILAKVQMDSGLFK